MKFRKYLLFLVIAAIAMVVAACGWIRQDPKQTKSEKQNRRNNKIIR